ncbi:MAG: cyclic nucleotide-binding domain-containing protein [Leptospirales bacterium]|nr:cyclic nucleotide-binding domain-containing protein [Leptospirales bacterium]
MKVRKSKRKAIAAVLGRFFRVADREAPRLASMGLLFFLLMGGLGLGRAAIESFFLAEAGADGIPLMYILNAALMTLASLAYSLLEDRIARYRFFQILFALFALVLAGLRLAIGSMQGGREGLAFAVFGYYELFIIIFQMHFWTFANDVFDPREGKRIFPYIGGMGIAGNIAGSLLAAPLVGVLGGTSNLFWIWAALIGLGAPGAYWVRRTALQAGLTHAASREAEGRSGTLFDNLRGLWDQPLIRRLAIIQAPLWAVVHTVDWLFLSALEEMTPDLDQRTATLGLLNGAVSITGLLVQFLVTGLVLRRAGIGPAFASYSISMTLGAAALLARSLMGAAGAVRDALNPRRILALSARFVDESILYSIYESAQQLLYNALPSAERGLARAFITGFMEPMATAAVGLILLLAARAEVGQPIIAGGAVGCGLIWIFLSLRVQRDYSGALLRNLSSRDIDQRDHAARQIEGIDRRESNRLLLQSVLGPDEEAALFAVRLIASAPDRRTLLALADAALRTASVVRCEILRVIGDEHQRLADPEGRNAVSVLLRTALGDDIASVRAAAVRAAGLFFSGDAPHVLQAMLEDSDVEVRQQAIVGLLRPVGVLRRGHKAYRSLQNLAQATHAEQRLAAVRSIRELGRGELRELLAPLTADRSVEVRYEAVRALSVYGDEQSVAALIACLEERSLAALAADTLARMGEKVMPQLLAQLQRPDLSNRQRAVVLTTLGELGGADAIESIGQYLTNQDLSVEDAAIGALSSIQERLESDGLSERQLRLLLSPGLQATLRRACGALIRRISHDRAFILRLRGSGRITGVALLIDSLSRISQHREEIALKFLQMLSHGPSIRAAAASLRSRDRRSISEAVELLEGAGPEAREFGRILEASINGQELLEEPVTDYEMIIDLLIQKQDPWFMSCVIFAIGELKMQELADHVESLTGHQWPAVRANAHLALRKLGRRKSGANKREVKAMSRTMERILFLRSVAIFADVDGADLQWINEITRERKVRKGQVVFHENDVGDAMYLILSGQVRVSRGATNLELLGERDCFGEMSILDNEPRSATVRATQDSVMLAIKRDDFQRLVLARPQISFSLFRTISRRLRDMTARLAAS